MATSTANSGGAWDNAKKYIKSIKSALVAEYGEARYGEIHNASVIGDTVGDGYKDVVGPNQDIMIKMMSTVSVIMLPVMSAFNLISLVMLQGSTAAPKVTNRWRCPYKTGASCRALEGSPAFRKRFSMAIKI
jgi:hypothetical protein